MSSALVAAVGELQPAAHALRSLVAPLADEMAARAGALEKADEARADAWPRLWDLFGPVGNRAGLKTSRYAVGSGGDAERV